MLERDAVRESVADALRRNSLVALIGPRPCGKTTLARQFLSPESANYFDLEDPESLARLQEPKTALDPLQGLVVIELGASWEGYAIEEVLRHEAPDEAFCWATHGGAELDLLMFRIGRRIGVECKRTDAPKMTTSMRVALQDLRLDELRVFYPGSKSYQLADAVSVHPLASLATVPQ